MPHLALWHRVVHVLLDNITQQLLQPSILVPFVCKVSFLSIIKLLVKLARTDGIKTETYHQLLVNDALLVNNFTIVTQLVRTVLVANTNLLIHKQMHAAKFVPLVENLLTLPLTVNFARTASIKH